MIMPISTKKTCLYCGSVFTKNPNSSIACWKRARYCSLKCAAKDLTRTGKGHRLKKGHKPSLETRKKLSRYLTGRPSSIKGKHPWSLESRKKFSEKMQGKNASNWQGGLKPLNKKIRAGLEFRLWREAVFARDNWICQKTGIRGGKLVPHHILNFAEYPELRFTIDNGVTLSEKTHIQFHKKYGWTNNTKEQLEEFLQ